MKNIQGYNEVFEKWLEDKIAEKVDQTNGIESEHFLSHRQVFKENYNRQVRQYLIDRLEKRIRNR